MNKQEGLQNQQAQHQEFGILTTNDGGSGFLPSGKVWFNIHDFTGDVGLEGKQRQIDNGLPGDHLQIIEHHAKEGNKHIANLDRNFKGWSFLKPKGPEIVQDIDADHKAEQQKHFYP